MAGPSSNQLGVQIIPAEVAKNPPPAYENVVSTDQGKIIQNVKVVGQRGHLYFGEFGTRNWYLSLF